MYFNYYAVKVKKLAEYLKKPVTLIDKDENNIYLEVDGKQVVYERLKFRQFIKGLGL